MRVALLGLALCSSAALLTAPALASEDAPSSSLSSASHAAPSSDPAPLDLMPRRLGQRRGVLVEPLRVDHDPSRVCITVLSRAMIDVFDVADKLGCLMMAVNNGLDQVGQVLAVALAAPLRLTMTMLTTVGRIGTMRVTVMPAGSVANSPPTTLGFTPTVIQSGGGFAFLGSF